jgi:hypothetical protein
MITTLAVDLIGRHGVAACPALLAGLGATATATPRGAIMALESESYRPR